MGGPEGILLDVVIILAAAKLGGEALRRLGQPALVGEVLAGVLLGPSLLNLLPSLQASGTAEVDVLLFLAELGLLLLLFEVGLETDLAAFRRTGVSAALVGVYGVVFSLLIGAGASFFIATRTDWVTTATAAGDPVLLHVFIGATLTATSIGITARVLRDLRVSATPEAAIILGAAVLDDVLGLIVLALVSAAATAAALTAFEVARLFLFAFGFFVAATLAGVWAGPRLLHLVDRVFKAEYVHLGFAVLFMLLLSYTATLAGLAPIVGAFAAGLAFHRSEHRQQIHDHVRPFGSLFIAVFFVTLGARIDLGLLAGPKGLVALAIALFLTASGVLAKVAAGLGVLGGVARRLPVGVGMVPRGEVGLIFAVFGLEAGLIENWQYATVIMVVLLTTLIAPLWLKRLKGRFSAEPASTAAAPEEPASHPA